LVEAVATLWDRFCLRSTEVLHEYRLRRLMECVRLRVKDVDFARRPISVREGKGNGTGGHISAADAAFGKRR
jgi:hypothetical protein